MAYNLFVTSVQGATRTSLRSPYRTRQDTESTIFMCACNVYETKEETRAFAQQVMAAPLGETIHHEATGISFRTEETD